MLRRNREVTFDRRANPGARPAKARRMLKFLASAAGIIFLIGLLVMIGIIALIF
ncbi:MAG TPA: hypothetical protein VF193_17165 [Steroidobacter sp.]